MDVATFHKFDGVSVAGNMPFFQLDINSEMWYDLERKVNYFKKAQLLFLVKYVHPAILMIVIFCCTRFATGMIKESGKLERVT
jgi:hypothetical protein